MIKDNTPFKNANPNDITQRFKGTEHKGLDIASKIGTWLVAPQDCVVEKIVTSTTLDESLAPLASGYGLVMRNKQNPNLKYLYWHCMAIFPVEVGQEVKRGQQVAQMGNSGFVKRGGVVVPVEVRLKPPYAGTHVHYEKFIQNTWEREYLDPEPNIDWLSGVDFNWWSEALIVLRKMLKIIKGRKW